MTPSMNPKIVSTQWAADHLHDPSVRFLEVGMNDSEYQSGHIPGAVAGWSFADIKRPDTQDIPDKSQVENMLSQAGISNEHIIIVYGGASNLVAAMAFWLLEIYGHADVRLLDGGRKKWVAEGRPLSTEKLVLPAGRYIARESDRNLRADKNFILSKLGQPGIQIVDARPVNMYTGDNLFGIARGGHIPGATNLPAEALLDAEGNIIGWQPSLTNPDGTFMPVDDMREILAAKGLLPDKQIITYCVRGGLSTYLWFALTQLLGYPNVREYDPSRGEWGNLAETPVEK